jgi:hypothetical protein
MKRLRKAGRVDGPAEAGPSCKASPRWNFRFQLQDSPHARGCRRRSGFFLPASAGCHFSLESRNCVPAGEPAIPGGGAARLCKRPRAVECAFRASGWKTWRCSCPESFSGCAPFRGSAPGSPSRRGPIDAPNPAHQGQRKQRFQPVRGRGGNPLAGNVRSLGRGGRPLECEVFFPAGTPCQDGVREWSSAIHPAPGHALHFVSAALELLPPGLLTPS